jgi:hypothetical protein
MRLNGSIGYWIGGPEDHTTAAAPQPLERKRDSFPESEPPHRFHRITGTSGLVTTLHPVP